MVRTLGLLQKIDGLFGKILIFFKFAKGGKIIVEGESNFFVSYRKVSALWQKNKTLNVRKTRKYDKGKETYRETIVFFFFLEKEKAQIIPEVASFLVRFPPYWIYAIVLVLNLHKHLDVWLYPP